MPIEARSFRGMPESAAHFQPLIAPQSVCKSGAYIGTNLRTRGDEYFDPWWLKVAEIISGAVFMITGARGGGKSTFMKILALRLMAFQAAVVGGLPDLMRTRINSRKSEKGESEFAPVTEYLYSRVHYLNRQASFNPFDLIMGMTEFDLIDASINMFEEVKKGDLDTLEALATMVGVRTMLSRPKPSPELLEYITRTQTLKDAEAYIRAANSKLVADAESAVEERPNTLPAELGKPAKQGPALHHIDEREFLAATTRVSIYLGRLLRGDYGGIIGGENSLSQVLSSPMVTLDWNDVPEKAASIMHSMLWRWQMSAVNSGNTALIPYLVFSDEFADAMNNLMAVRSYAAYVMKARAFHTADFISTQFRNQIVRAGAENSQIRSLARDISLGMGAEFIFRQPYDEQVLHELTERGISEQDAYLTTQFGTGEMGIKYPDRPLQLVQVHIGPTEKNLVPTNAASESMVADRHSVHDFAVVQDRIARLQQQQLLDDEPNEEGAA